MQPRGISVSCPRPSGYKGSRCWSLQADAAPAWSCRALFRKTSRSSNWHLCRRLRRVARFSSPAARCCWFYGEKMIFWTIGPSTGMNIIGMNNRTYNHPTRATNHCKPVIHGSFLGSCMKEYTRVIYQPLRIRCSYGMVDNASYVANYLGNKFSFCLYENLLRHKIKIIWETQLNYLGNYGGCHGLVSNSLIHIKC